MRQWVCSTLSCVVACAVLTGCASVKRPPMVSIDCALSDSRCHEGRFGLTYRLERNGNLDEDAVNGTWRWESSTSNTASDPAGGDTRPLRARLELSTVLGNRLAIVEQDNRHLLLTDAKGRQYLARDWNDLFSTLFEMQLPGEAVARWMHDGAHPSVAPELSVPGWQADTGHARRLRLIWQGSSGRIRLDLIPDTASP